MFKPKDWLDRRLRDRHHRQGPQRPCRAGRRPAAAVRDARRTFIIWLSVLTQGELSEDPHDFVARYLLHTANGLTGSAVLFGAVYLLLHGAVKVVLVIALLLNKLWAYPCMIVVLLIFIGYQLYRIALHPECGPDRTHGVRRADRHADLAGIPPAAAHPEGSRIRHGCQPVSRKVAER